MATESERRSFNNDGMDPDWKPAFTKRVNAGTRLDELLLALEPLAKVLGSADDLKSGQGTKITMGNGKWKAILEAYTALETP